MSDDVSAALPDLDVLAADLNAVGVALTAIEDGSYGRCVTCDAVIPDEVLTTDPVAVHCEDHRIGDATASRPEDGQTASESTGVASD